MKDPLVSIPFREELHSDVCFADSDGAWIYESFHPFQGRAPFGPDLLSVLLGTHVPQFPSLSGKSSIRTNPATHSRRQEKTGSFHPFQGRAPFGQTGKLHPFEPGQDGFHPFQGRAPFGQEKYNPGGVEPPGSFHPFQGRAPFGQTYGRSSNCSSPSSFHPFQGRAPFGQSVLLNQQTKSCLMFPSLSGKSSIRTDFIKILKAAIEIEFPSLSGKSSIRTKNSENSSIYAGRRVSIPFREELHSDRGKKHCRANKNA